MPKRKYPSFCPYNHADPYPPCVRPESCERCQREHVDGETK
jgi:hypothetical protein